MKKGKSVFVLFCLFFVFFAVAEENYFEDVYHFPGVSSRYQYQGKSYAVEGTALSTQIRHMDQLYSDGKKKVLMGHSAGGLKAMAYASLLCRKGKGSEVKGVITMGAPLKGFGGLAQGRGVLNARLLNKIYLIERAADGVVDVADTLVSLFSPLILAIPPESVNVTYGILKPGVKMTASKALGFSLFQRPLDMLNVFGMNPQFVEEISPNSSFLNEYIHPRTTIKRQGYYETRKKRTGLGYWKAVWSTGKTWFGWKYSYISGWKWVDIYHYYQVYINPTYYYYPRINSDIPVGMIVGKENDPLSALDGDTQKKIRKGISDLSNTLTAVEAVQWVKSGLAYASLIFAWKGAICTSNALACRSARDIVQNYKSHYGELLGGRQNDCFITEESQQYRLSHPDRNALGGTPIISRTKKSVFESPANHFEEPGHESIWGKGGGASVDDSNADESKRKRLKKGSIQPEGILARCFEAQKWSYRE